MFSETSGLISSRRHEAQLWLHNDSGDGPKLYAMSTAGTYLGVLTLDGAQAIDWEDLTLDPDPEGDVDHLLVADIGDNAKQRSQISVYRVAEPELDTVPASLSTTSFERFDFTYPDGPHDAEAIFWDERQELLYLLSKEPGESSLYSTPLISGGGPQVLSYQAPVGIFPENQNPLVTGADLSPSGSFLAVRTYSHILVWTRSASQTIPEALAEAPCTSWAHSEAQGEAIAWASDKTQILTLSEQTSQPVYGVPLVTGAP